MKNGSIEFVACIAEKFRGYIQPYVAYENNESADAQEHASELNSKGIGQAHYRAVRRQE